MPERDHAFTEALIAVKQDRQRLLDAFGLTRGGAHAKCPWCGDTTLSFFSKDGLEKWRCHKGCGSGTIVDALARLENKEPGLVCKELVGNTGRNGHGPTTTTSNIYNAAHSYSPQSQPPNRYTNAPARNGHKPSGDDKNGKKYAVPELDTAKLMPFVEGAHTFLLANSLAYLEQRRCITREVAEEYKLGYLENREFEYTSEDGRPYTKLYPASWVLPITDAKGVIRGVKLHHDIPPTFGGPGGNQFKGKSEWCPFGTRPKENAYYCLWPHPETQTPEPPAPMSGLVDPLIWVKRLPKKHALRGDWEAILNQEECQYCLDNGIAGLTEAQRDLCVQKAWGILGEKIQKAARKTKHEPEGEEGPATASASNVGEWLFIVPGELKALAIISRGFRACAPTGGESFTPTREMLAPLRNQKIILPYDDDVPKLDTSGKLRCPGKEWARRMTEALSGVGAREIRAATGGRG